MERSGPTAEPDQGIPVTPVFPQRDAECAPAPSPSQRTISVGVHPQVYETGVQVNIGTSWWPSWWRWWWNSQTPNTQRPLPTTTPPNTSRQFTTLHSDIWIAGDSTTPLPTPQSNHNRHSVREARLSFAIPKPHVSKPADESHPLTNEETHVLEGVKRHIGEKANHAPHEMLVRFVRGYSFEAKTKGQDGWLQVVCTEIDKTLAWRSQVHADTLIENPPSKWSTYKRAWPSAVVGTDNQGHPIVVERFETFDLTTLTSQFDTHEIAVYQARNMEKLQAVKKGISDQLGVLIYKHCYIVDAKGLNSSAYTCREHIKAVLNVAQYYYPETLYKMFVLNAPFVFRAIWSAVSPLIHPITREKIKVLGKNAIAELQAEGIDASQIPPSIGGSWTGT